MNSNQNLLSLGQILKEKREDQGLSLQKISEWTKISVQILQAIEEAKADELPVYTYLRGFILSYAKALGMDEKEIEKELKTLISPEELVYLPGATSSLEAETLIEKDMRLTPVILAISILFIIGGILALTTVISSYQKRNKGAFSEKGKSSRGDSSLADTSFLSEDLASKQKVATDKTPNENSKEAKPLSVVPTSEVKKTALEVIVKAVGDVKVFYRVDKEALKEVSLSEDQFEVLKGIKNIFIRTDHSDLIYVFHNGKDMGLFGSGGEKEKYFYSRGEKEKLP